MNDLFAKVKTELGISNLKKLVSQISENQKNSPTERSGCDVVLQQAFRAALLERDKKCLICGIENHLVLRASHILSYELCTDEEAFDSANGILLCTLHDGLFDSGALTFMNNKVVLSSELSKFDVEKIIALQINGVICLPDGHEKYMNIHNEIEFEKFKSDVQIKRKKYKSNLQNKILHK